MQAGGELGTTVRLATPADAAAIAAVHAEGIRTRTATVVNGAGLLVRAPFGKRVMPWNDVRGLSVTGRAVYAVLRDGSIRLPCVRVSMLSELARASGGRLPPLADPVVKTPPERRRRR